MLVVEDGVEELEDELLFLAGEELDLLELALELRGRAGRVWGQACLSCVARPDDCDDWGQACVSCVSQCRNGMQEWGRACINCINSDP